MRTSALARSPLQPRAPRTPRPTISDVADRAIAAMQQSTDVCVMAQAACDIGLEIATRARAVDVSVVTDTMIVPIAFAGGAISDVYALMADCASGPPRTAVEQTSPVVATSLRTDARWSCFGPRAARRGVDAVISVALELGHESCAMTYWFPDRSCIDDQVELNTLLIASLLGAAAPFATEVATLKRTLLVNVAEQVASTHAS